MEVGAIQTIYPPPTHTRTHTQMVVATVQQTHTRCMAALRRCVTLSQNPLTLSRIHTHTHIQVQVHTHTYTHTHIHTYTHTHTHTHRNRCFEGQLMSDEDRRVRAHTVWVDRLWWFGVNYCCASTTYVRFPSHPHPSCIGQADRTVRAAARARASILNTRLSSHPQHPSVQPPSTPVCPATLNTRLSSHPQHTHTRDARTLIVLQPHHNPVLSLPIHYPRSNVSQERMTALRQTPTKRMPSVEEEVPRPTHTHTHALTHTHAFAPHAAP